MKKGGKDVRRTLLIVTLCLAVVLSNRAPLSAATDPKALDREISSATYYVEEFEKELARLRGSRSERYFNMDEASKRVMALHERHPDDPRVRDLFARMRDALMKTQGDYITITPEMLAYRQQEEALLKKLGELADKKLRELLGKAEAETPPLLTEPKFETMDLATLKEHLTPEQLKVLSASLSPDGQADATKLLQRLSSEEDGLLTSEEQTVLAELATVAEEQRKGREQYGYTIPQGIITKLFPTPDWRYTTIDELKDRYVLLTDVRYPERQFFGSSGEYIALGKPSEGYWFVKIDGRDWLGPWEAMKRCRREAITALEDVEGWTVLGKITAITNEVPQAEEVKTMPFQWGWVVTPIALHAPGLVTAWYDPGAEKSGLFAGEEGLRAIKEAGYTVKALPADTTPLQVMETFVTAIKEKNKELYLACVDPARYKTGQGYDLVANYHWDLHQMRFREHYVTVTFGEPRIETNKGFDERSKAMDYFLTAEQKDTARQIGGTRVEYAYIDCKAWDENGRQYGSPKEYQLKRVGDGPWMVETYDVPF